MESRGDRIKQRRQEVGLTQRQIAEMARPTLYGFPSLPATLLLQGPMLTAVRFNLV